MFIKCELLPLRQLCPINSQSIEIFFFLKENWKALDNSDNGDEMEIKKFNVGNFPPTLLSGKILMNMKLWKRRWSEQLTHYIILHFFIKIQVAFLPGFLSINPLVSCDLGKLLFLGVLYHRISKNVSRSQKILRDLKKCFEISNNALGSQKNVV